MAIIENKYNLGLDITEEEYRKIPYPSYSFFSDLEKVGMKPELLDPTKKNNIDDLDGIIYGKYVDSLLLENKEPDNLIVVKKKPSSKPKKILKALKRNINLLSNKDIFHEDNKELIMELCDSLKYYHSPKKRTYEQRVAALKNYEEYFNKYEPEKFIITEYMYNSAIKAVNSLKHLDIFANPEIEVIPQVKLTGIFSNIKVKGMLDMVVIDHKNKTITPVDLKTGSTGSGNFIKNGYIGWNYYIQSRLYSYLLASELKFKNNSEIKDYEIQSFKFIYYDRLKNDWIVFDSKDTDGKDFNTHVNLANVTCEKITTIDCRYRFDVKITHSSGATTTEIFYKPSLLSLIHTLKEHLKDNKLHLYYNALT